jgi:phage shock protein E
MDLNQLREELKTKKAILLDVREKKEWDEGHLKDAQHFPISALNEENIPDHFPQDKIIYTHCKKGGRAQQAANILKKKYKHVNPLKHTFEELKQNLD